MRYEIFYNTIYSTEYELLYGTACRPLSGGAAERKINFRPEEVMNSGGPSRLRPTVVAFGVISQR